MAGTFIFSQNTFTSAQLAKLTVFSTGDVTGTINNPALNSATSLGQMDGLDDRDIVAIGLNAGTTYTFDIDDGANDGAGDVDLELNIVNAAGTLVATNDDASADAGSIGALDPRISFNPTETGIYFVTVAHFPDDYVADTFGFDSGGTDGTGDYRLNISASSLPVLQSLGKGGQNITFSDLAQRVDAGKGNDILEMKGGNDIVDGGVGADNIQGQNDNDLLFGGADNDTLDGGKGNDGVVGEAGNDTVIGGKGNDDVFGGTGNDKVQGGKGTDFVFGEAGQDTLVGGTGNDEFVFMSISDSTVAASDSIDDFNRVLGDDDTINLAGVFNGTLTFIGAAAFFAAGQVRSVDLGAIQQVEVNTSGVSGAEMRIFVEFAPPLIAADFDLA